ncbi:MAG TPA: hypothetical protein VFN57_14945 [Thermomicrobiaceae bacterium]|nr:hypothetical protein [Thermomicrobiaceae bacterium]
MLRFKHWRFLGTLVLVLMMALPSVALAKKGPPATEATNNLSVPTVMYGVGSFSPTCGTLATPSALSAPTGTPTEYPVDSGDYYYLQGTSTWQAQCFTDTTDQIGASVDWGDNLEGTALKAGTPIRVEVGLLDPTLTDTLGAAVTVPDMQGYNVLKLNEALSDKDSPYGTLATQASDGTWSATDILNTTNGVGARAYDPDATFSLYNTTTSTYVVAPGTAFTAEINATGKIVYGYNWGIGGHGVKSLPTAGVYVLTFSTPHIHLTVTNGTVSAGGHTASLEFTVAPKK